MQITWATKHAWVKNAWIKNGRQACSSPALATHRNTDNPGCTWNPRLVKIQVEVCKIAGWQNCCKILPATVVPNPVVNGGSGVLSYPLVCAQNGMVVFLYLHGTWKWSQPAKSHGRHVHLSVDKRRRFSEVFATNISIYKEIYFLPEHNTTVKRGSRFTEHCHFISKCCNQVSDPKWV